MIGAILQNRYKIESELGRGGMGVVYRARDQKLDRPVAIKMIKKNGGAAEDNTQMWAEAQAVARLNHPNIVAVYDVGETDDQTYLVMELVEGSSLRDLHHLPMHQVLEIALQVTGALEQTHALGIIHRDLKPENIFITPAHNTKLMDFGLAHKIGTQHITGENAIVGTMAYIAPEIIRGEEASPQSDLYALGLILYEMVTDRPAYSGQDIIAILSQHLHATVEPPSTHNPQVPAEMEALILRLLAKDPQHRPASASEVHQVLEALRSGAVSSAPASQSAPLDRIVRGRMIARQDELGEMLALWKRALQGESRLLLVSGEPGIGKTRLVKELLTRVGLQGGLALLGECYAYGGAPYAPLAQIIEGALLGGEKLPNENPAECLSPMILADLVAMAPALAARFNLPPNPPLEEQAEQQRLFAAFTGLVECITRQRPLLLVMDDAHWADGGSLALLRFLGRRAARARWPLLIVLTYRETELSEARALNEALVDLQRERLPDDSPAAVRIKLNRFTRQQTAMLLEAMFAEPVADAFCDSIQQETEGNPFFVEEVCKSLIDEGKLYRRNGRWELAEMRDLHIPQSVRVAIEARISRLPDLVQEILRLAAVFGRRFDFDTLRHAFGINGKEGHSEDDLVDALEQAERLQLLSEVGQASGGVFAFTHALIPATLVEGASGLRLRRLHRKAIETITALHPDDYESLAYHSVQAADDALALEYYHKAGDRARRLYANENAIRFFGEALALLPDEDPLRTHLLSSRAAVYGLLARRSAQYADIQEMLELARDSEDPEGQCDALTSMAEYGLATEIETARQPAEQALEIARRLDDPLRQGRALGILARLEMNFSNLSSREYFEQAIECLRQAGRKGSVAIHLNWLSLVNVRTGHYDEARKQLEEAIAISRQINDRRLEANNLRRMGTNAIYEGDFQAALPLIQQAADLHRQVGDREGECHAYNGIGACFVQLGELEQAGEYYQRSLRLAEEIGLVLGMSNAVSNLVAAYYPRCGEYETALALVDEQLRRPEFIEEENLWIGLLGSKRDLLYQVGQYSAAVEVARDVLRRRQASGALENTIEALNRLALILTDMEDFDQARQTAEQALAEAQRSEDPRLQNLAHFPLGYLDLRQGSPQALLDGLEHVEAILQSLQDQQSRNFDHIEPLMLKGNLLLKLGQPEAALKAIEPVRSYLDITPPRWHNAACYYFARVLHATGQPGAQRYLQPAYDHVTTAVQKFTSPDLRQSYLQTVIPGGVLALWKQIAVFAASSHESEAPLPE